MTLKTASPFMGIIMLDTVFPRIPGDIGCPGTYDFPVRYEIVKGASPRRVVIEADPALLSPFIRAGQKLVDQGAAALATSCGFLAIFHQALVRAFRVPVFSSSLLQVSQAAALIGPGKKVGILTARKASLTRAHLAGVGIDGTGIAVHGMEEAPEFTAVFIKGKTTLDREKCEGEMKDAARALVSRHPDVGAIVLECTNMPPYTAAVKSASGGLPVFDSLTLLNTAWAACTG